jgi:hypothetical protein
MGQLENESYWFKNAENHLLLRWPKKLKESYPEWSFHLVGKDYEDDYSPHKIKKKKEIWAFL